MDLNKLKLFYFVAETGSYTKAARHLNIKQPTINKHVKALELELKVALLKRHKYGVKLTDEGHKLYFTAKKIIDEIKIVETYFDKDKKSIDDLIIASSLGISTDWLIKFIPEFIKINSHVNIKIISNNNDTDHSHADITIGPKLTTHSDLIQKKLYSFEFKLYASKGYIINHQRPKNKSDLKNHKLIFQSSDNNVAFKDANYLFGDPVNATPHIEINSSIGKYRLVESGVGIGAICRDLTFFNKDSLIDLFPHETPLEIETFYIYNKNNHKIGIVESFFNHIKNNI